MSEMSAKQVKFTPSNLFEMDCMKEKRSFESNKTRITLIGQNGTVVKTYEGTFDIIYRESDKMAFVDECGVRHDILNQGGFIIIEFYEQNI